LDHAGLEILDVDQCLRLLRSVQVGRVALSTPAAPLIFPVNFVVLDTSVVFRTGEGTKLDAAIRNVAVAFEADAVRRTIGCQQAQAHPISESRPRSKAARDQRGFPRITAGLARMVAIFRIVRKPGFEERDY
jgi:hypothetical protein